MLLRKLVDRLARKILHLWVSTRVLPKPVSDLQLDLHLPVIYVVETRSWSNLLVLQQQCERFAMPSPIERLHVDEVPELKRWHSVYTIAPREPVKGWLKNPPKRSRMLRGIVEILRENPGQRVLLVPVSIFWGRPVATQKNWLQIFFADSWGAINWLKKLFTIAIHGRETLVKFSDVIGLDAVDFTDLANDDVIDQLQQTLSRRLRENRIETLGPDISHRRTLVRKLIMNPAVQNAISKRSAEEGRSGYKIALQAHRYLDEIVANCSQVTIRLMQLGLTAFWNRFYSGIELYHKDTLKNLSPIHEIIYVPCHRSHIDYLLLSYVIYHEGLAIPYIAAGKNLNMPIIGRILRGGGAFFIRRSFKGNELYSTVMFEYIASLVAQGVPVEYFVEGGRSRTGRLLQPKPGMLSMSVRAFLKYRKKPLAFVPVYIGYEKLMEGKAYQAELSGEDKKSETFINSIRSIFRIRGNFGKVHVNFAEPVFLNQLLDVNHPGWAAEPFDDTARPEWVRSLVSRLGDKIMYAINHATMVNPVNLVAAVMLSTSRQSIAERELHDMLDFYQELLRDLRYAPTVVVTDKSGAEQVRYVESLKMLKRKKHEFGDIIVIDQKHAVSMTYYRNNILHLTALPSLVACCFLDDAEHDLTSVATVVEGVYPFLQKELFLKWRAEELDSAIGNILDFLLANGLLTIESDNKKYSLNGDQGAGASRFVLLANAISPVVELDYLMLALLRQSATEKIKKEKYEKNCYLMAQRVAMIHELNSPDFSDKHLIANFFGLLEKGDFIRLTKDGSIQTTGKLADVEKNFSILLSRQTRSNILQTIKMQE